MTEQIPSSMDVSTANRRAVISLAVLFGAFVFVITTLVFLIFTAWISVFIAPFVGLVVALAWVFLALRTAASAVLDLSEVEPADVVEHARYFNVAAGLSVAVGVSAPRLYVVDDDAINAMVVGTNARDASVAVTKGMLEAFDVVELEGALALVFQRIRTEEIAAATFVVPTFGALALAGEHLDGMPALKHLLESTMPFAQRIIARLHPAEQEFVADIEATLATRYPPALASALAKMDGRSALAMGAPVTAHLWLASPINSALNSGMAEIHKPISERIAVLQEL